MKFKFVKKGTEISSEQVSQLMNFEQVVDKAAGLGSAPLAKGALASKSAFVSKALWLAAVPFTAAVYLGITELAKESPVVEPDDMVQETVISEDIGPEIVADSMNTDSQQPVATKAVNINQQVADDAEEEEEEDKASTPAPVPTQQADDILVKEDIMIKAEPVNGFPAFYDTIDRELTYPEDARISGLEGFVRVYFVVDKDGKAGNFRVVQSLGNDFDEEALRVMRKLTEWKPAMHNGTAVSSHLSIKLRFELEKE